jgi:hypothetical protein
MRKLVLVLTIAFIATNAAGCIFSSSGDDDGEVIADVGWVFKDIATNTETGCPAGFDTVVVVAHETNAAGEIIDPKPYIDLLDCVDGIAANRVSYDPGFYNIFLEVRDGGEAGPLYAQSLSELFDLNVADDTFDYVIFNDGGYFQMAWDLIDKTTRAPLDCAQAATNKIEITATVSSTTEAASLRFACQDGQGVTDGILEGNYVVSLAALNVGETAPVGVAPAVNTSIRPQNEVTNLQTIVIEID